MIKAKDNFEKQSTWALSTIQFTISHEEKLFLSSLSRLKILPSQLDEVLMIQLQSMRTLQIITFYYHETLFARHPYDLQNTRKWVFVPFDKDLVICTAPHMSDWRLEIEKS